MAAFPPDQAEMTKWFCEHQTEWQDGTAFRFAVLQNGRMIGLVDLDQIRDGKGDLGYWLDEPCWGRGFALESAKVVLRFAFKEVRLKGLRSGHAVDNPASGRVLAKLGFRHTDEVMVRSRSRGASILQRRYRLELHDFSSGQN